jgi:ABC-type uncharacterized transport system substrate-binding protein
MAEKRTIIGIKRAFFFLAAFLMTNAVLNRPVSAHPHVWVTMTSEIAYDPNGQVEGVRHAWSFDEAYSAFAVQGLDTNQDGTTSREELQELAKINTESLIEFNYFTVVKADGKMQEFAAPKDYWLEFDGKNLTLHFTLPLATAIKAARTLWVEMYDPTYFVSFSFNEKPDPVMLAGAPAGCSLTVTRPKPPETASLQAMGETFFDTLSAGSDFGAQFASRVLVACP